MPPKPQATVTLEEIILSSSPAQREVIVSLRDRVNEAERHANELQSELNFARQRIVELESDVQAAQTHAPNIPAPQTNLEELIAQLKSQHQAQVEAHRRQTTEKIHNLEDTTFDAEAALQTSVSRSMRPLPKNFEFIDLLQLREQYTADGYAPASPVQQPLVKEFVSHIDGVRQCTKDNRFAQLYYDPIKADLLRRIRDLTPIHAARQDNIRQQQINIGPFLQCRHRGSPCRCHDNVISHVRQLHRQLLSDQIVILDDQNRHVSGPSSGGARGPLRKRALVEADGRRGGKVQRLGLAVDGHDNGAVSASQLLGGQPPRLVAEQPRGRSVKVTIGPGGQQVVTRNVGREHANPRLTQGV